MNRENTSNMPRARLVAIAAAAAFISACGGGGGGPEGFATLPVSPAPEQPAPAVVDSSAPCFNEADFREGTLLEFDAVKPGADPATASFHRKTVTEGREAFAGANPVAFNVASETVDSAQYRQSTVKKEYKDFANGNILLYGKSATYKNTIDPKVAAAFPSVFPSGNASYVTQTYEPPFSFPVDIKSGQVVKQQTSVSKKEVLNGRSGATTSLQANAELTYIGREKLETAMGTFDTCKLSLKMTIGGSVLTKEFANEFWVAAEGPYRGQFLKGLDPKAPMVVTKMTYSPK
ncbi:MULTISPECIES: hypothetical protein [unclassified Variovorax]|uniref:hypothetical protein n=1 Tax=unclassified Variovorax TaxID=663243 RepID=UPI003F445657